jgi:hypothetical protein
MQEGDVQSFYEIIEAKIVDLEWFVDRLTDEQCFMLITGYMYAQSVSVFPGFGYDRDSNGDLRAFWNAKDKEKKQFVLTDEMRKNLRAGIDAVLIGNLRHIARTVITDNLPAPVEA